MDLQCTLNVFLYICPLWDSLCFLFSCPGLIWVSYRVILCTQEKVLLLILDLEFVLLTKNGCSLISVFTKILCSPEKPLLYINIATIRLIQCDLFLKKATTILNLSVFLLWPAVYIATVSKHGQFFIFTNFHIGWRHRDTNPFFYL